MIHDISHCDAEITPGEMCPRRLLCQRFLVHNDAIKNKLKDIAYLSAYCCTQSQYIISGVAYDKIPYNEFKGTHESRSAKASKSVHQSTGKSRASATKSKTH